ncbi:MAG: hypothetical protein ILA17_05410 [Ruminococcus sp.]|nr:hypothetical protein [Ruminococcus sp.]
MIRKIPKDTDCFHFYNANPNGDRAADCAIRALCTAMRQSWEFTLKGLVEVALEHKLSPIETKCIEIYLKERGWVKHKQPRKANGKKYTGKEFCKEHLSYAWLNDRVIANIGGHHITAIIEGRINDTLDCSEYCIGNYWTPPEDNVPF